MPKLYEYLVLIILTTVLSCSQNISGRNYGSPNVKQELLDEKTLKITQYSTDKSYGYTAKNPIMVGGLNEGPLNELRFLNALTGPNGEMLQYNRLGSCCAFNTENSELGGGMLDQFSVTYEGLENSLVLYLNMYDSDTLKVPVGLELKK